MSAAVRIMKQGSSPRVRGAGLHRKGKRTLLGIIPARAGSSSGSDACCGEPRDHPRACGEQTCCVGTIDDDPGSSPRVRGAGSLSIFSGRLPRIIPARAGSRASLCRSVEGLRDHPRACGEQSGRLPIGAFAKGSSPRVRGAVSANQVVSSRLGIIPARAGSRMSIEQAKAVCRDHPRACGEQPFAAFRSAKMPGSSPRVRGAAEYAAAMPVAVGIIPARAGSRLPTCSRTSPTRDHPRACGEQWCD